MVHAHCMSFEAWPEIAKLQFFFLVLSQRVKSIVIRMVSNHASIAIE